MRNRVWSFLFCAALLSSVAFSQQPAVAPASQATERTPAELVSALKSGGYVVYFRHAATDFSQNDEKMRDFDDCANQRNLTDGGREQSKRIGAAWRALGIRVGKVYASPYCRTRETAQLAFGKYERAGEARGGPGTASDSARYRPLSLMLATAPANGVNDVIVSHGNPFRALHQDMPYLAEGEAAIIKPLGDGKHEVFGRVTSDSWQK
jgi:broad specificity phosphatase PhoE